jgi:hypothetical protein
MKIDITAELGMTPKHIEILAYTGGLLRVDGFADPVVVDLNGLEASGSIPIAIKHDLGDSMILGQTNDNQILNDGASLILGGDITADPELSPAVKRVLAMAANGHKWQASIGAQIDESQDIAAGQTVEVNGQTLTGPFILATKATLREVSVLGMGADKNTSVILSAEAKLALKAMGNYMAGQIDETGFENYVKQDLGMDAAQMTEECRSALASHYAMLTSDKNDTIDADAKTAEMENPPQTNEQEEATETPAEDSAAEEDAETKTPKMKAKSNMSASQKIGGDGASTDDSILRSRQRYAAEARRVSAIQAKCSGDQMLAAKAIEQGWSEDKAELELLRRQRAQAPAGHVVSSTNADTLQALQGGMLLRAGCKLDNPGFSGELGFALNLPTWLRAGVNADVRQKAMEASWKYRDMSMVDLCRAAVAIGGDPKGLLDGSNQGFIRAAVSGGQLADIFSTNINALLIQKMLEETDSTVGWTRESDAANFQTMERTRLTKGPRLTKHARGGEADNATRADVSQSYKISRYSQQFKVDEMDIIDDRFNALQDIPNEMGLACMRLRPDLVYSILLSNPTINKEDGTSGALFSTSNPGSQSNYDASGAALSSATLQAGIAKMFNFLENKVPIQSNPTHLIVPAVLFGTAASLLQSPTIVVAGTAGTVTTKGSINEIQAMTQSWGLISIMSDARLTSGVTDPVTGTTYSGSTTAWYLATNKVPGIEVAYLRGSGRAPQVRQYMLDRGNWGIGWDVNLDIGAKALAWQGFYGANA